MFKMIGPHDQRRTTSRDSLACPWRRFGGLWFSLLPAQFKLFLVEGGNETPEISLAPRIPVPTLVAVDENSGSSLVKPDMNIHVFSSGTYAPEETTPQILRLRHSRLCEADSAQLCKRAAYAAYGVLRCPQCKSRFYSNIARRYSHRIINSLVKTLDVCATEPLSWPNVKHSVDNEIIFNISATEMSRNDTAESTGTCYLENQASRRMAKTSVDITFGKPNKGKVYARAICDQLLDQDIEEHSVGFADVETCDKCGEFVSISENAIDPRFFFKQESQLEKRKCPRNTGARGQRSLAKHCKTKEKTKRHFM
eukprot:GHVT01005423.1.p1 GENE.GHVT01005423.1~~GHVT01005423.1.p1  ORF type:complete len:310 (+),score=12.61 GHVT01005423.1:1857-2786(+)